MLIQQFQHNVFHREKIGFSGTHLESIVIISTSFETMTSLLTPESSHCSWFSCESRQVIWTRFYEMDSEREGSWHKRPRGSPTGATPSQVREKRVRLPQSTLVRKTLDFSNKSMHSRYVPSSVWSLNETRVSSTSQQPVAHHH